MKKIISVLTSLMVMMLLVGNVMGALAAVTPSFFVSIADEKVTEGTETAEVPIYIGANDLSAVVLDLDIPEELDLIEVKSTSSDVQSNIKEGVVFFNSSTSEVNKFDINKEFAKLVFKIPTNAKAGDKYPIGFKSDSQGNVDIDASNVSGELITPTIKTGSISITKGGLNLYIDSKSCDVGTEEVEVPFRVDALGGIAALNVQINVDNGAEITNVKAVDGYSNEGFQYNSEENVFLWNPFQNENFPFERDNIFANITVKLPENLKVGDTFKISVTYVDASDAERNLMSPENEPVFGVITVGSPVDIKVHDVVIDTQEEFDALKTVVDYSYITTTIDSTKKVVEVPIEVLNNPGMFTCKNKLILDEDLEIIGYKATNNSLDTLESSTLTYSKDKQTIIWTKESAGDSKALGNMAVALIAIPNKDFEEATYSVDLDNYTAEFSTAVFNHIAFNLENGSIKLIPNEITTTTTAEPASTEFSIDVAKVEVNYSTVDQVVKVPVSIKNNLGFASFKFNFETSGLEIKSIIEDGIINGINASRNNTSLLWVVEDPNGNNDIKQDGVLFTLEVLVPAGTAPGVYPIELTLGKEAIVDSNYNVQVPAEINNGHVEVIDVLTTSEVTTGTGVTSDVTGVTTTGTGVTSDVTGVTTTGTGVTSDVTGITTTGTGVTSDVTGVTTTGTGVTSDVTGVTTTGTGVTSDVTGVTTTGTGVTSDVTGVTTTGTGVTSDVTGVTTTGTGVTSDVTAVTTTGTGVTSNVTGVTTTGTGVTSDVTAVTTTGTGVTSDVTGVTTTGTGVTSDVTTGVTTEPTSKEFSIDIAKVTVNYSTVDQVVKVPVSINNNPGFSSFKFNFETSGLEIKSIIEDGIITGINPSRNNTSLIWILDETNGNNDIKQDGILFTLEVLVPAGTIPGVYPIELTLGKEAIVDSNYNVQIPSEINNGHVEVIDVLTTSDVTTGVTTTGTVVTSDVTGVTTTETGVTSDVTTGVTTTGTGVTSDVTTGVITTGTGVTSDVTTGTGVTSDVTTGVITTGTGVTSDVTTGVTTTGTGVTSGVTTGVTTTGTELTSGVTTGVTTTGTGVTSGVTTGVTTTGTELTSGVTTGVITTGTGVTSGVTTGVITTGTGVTSGVTTGVITTGTGVTSDVTTGVTTTELESKEFSIDIAKVTVNYSTVDQVVKVPVSIKNNPGFASFKFNFETSGLGIKSIIEDGMISGISASRNNTSLIWLIEDPSGNNDIKQDGILFTLEVLVPAGTAPGVYPIELTLGKEDIVDSNYNVQIPTEINNGHVEVIDVLTTSEETTVTATGTVVTSDVTTGVTTTGTVVTSDVTTEVTTTGTVVTSNVTTEVTTTGTVVTSNVTTGITTTGTVVTSDVTTGVTTTGTVVTSDVTTGVTTGFTTTGTVVTSNVTTGVTTGFTTTGTVVTSNVTTGVTTTEGVGTGTNSTTVLTGETGTDITTIKVFGFEIEKVKINESSEVQMVPVKVMIHQNPGMVGAKFKFNLPEGMRIESVSDRILAGVVSSRVNNTVLWMDPNTQNLSQNGTMFTLLISVPAGMAPGTYPITFGDFGEEDIIDSNYNSQVPAEINNGYIEVIGITTSGVTGEVTTVSEVTGEVTTVSGVTGEVTTVSEVTGEVTTVITIVTQTITSTTTEGIETGTQNTTVLTGGTVTDITKEITVFAFEIEKVKVNEYPEAQTVPVKVIIHQNPGMVAAKFKFNLPEGMKIESVSDGILSGVVNSRENNTVVWMDGDVQNISQNGTMFTLNISIPVGMAPGTYPITFGNFGEEDIVSTDYTILTPKQLIDGEIEIIALTPTETTITTVSDTTVSETTITTVSDTTPSETTITTVSDTTPSETTITTVSDTTASETTVTTVSDTTPSETTITTVSDTTPSETTTSISERATIKVNKPIKFNFAHDEKFDLTGLDVTAIITRVAIFEDGTTKDIETTTENISAVCAPLGTPKNTYDKTSFVYDVPLEYKGINQLIADEFKKTAQTFKAIIGQKGDANLNHDVTTLDVVEVLNYINATNLGQTYSMASELISIEDLTDDFSIFLANVDESENGVDTKDAVFILNYINACNLAANIDDVHWNDILGS